MSVLDRAFAAVYDKLMAGVEHAGLSDERRELLAPLGGTVVEVGAGTGANLPFYPTDLDRLVLLEPSPPMARRLRAAAADTRPDAEVVEAPAESIPLPDDSMDHVVSTLVLCTVTLLDRTLDEIRRVLRPGGSLVILEHVAADGGLRRRLQDALNPAWRFVARGCNLNRETGAALERHGFEGAEQLAHVNLPGIERTGPALVGAVRLPA